ncbi:NAD(P)H-dependent oxidoreductase [Photobacterium sp. 1_MG-2023]|uniref:NAD(P)H-dependent oxidoreductase n=1 Tax=Photobacterium sp. 1_MG-2023 TaxID=3062646 RepID=UPI0026E31ED4|nr:NAD(P)H-dependent oxidoreductase [Photobacterium sp. 1_MG-2023]MDO6708584.1 NAD(P)H-dependent oxidoreductase [Photobacterium sp. 1_MG-2023]
MRKNILLLNANPKTESFARALADAYEIEAREQFTVHRLNLSDMEFDPNLAAGYDAIQPLEPGLKAFQRQLAGADHLVLIAPIWWGGLPAQLKGFIDRTFLPGFAFQFEGDSPEPVPLLKGKTARIILTMDAPAEMLAEQAEPVLAQLDRFTLQFCGFSPAETTLLGSVILSTETQRQLWLKDIQALGRQGL